jgi:hypothetical protein
MPPANNHQLHQYQAVEVKIMQKPLCRSYITIYRGVFVSLQFICAANSTISGFEFRWKKSEFKALEIQKTFNSSDLLFGFQILKRFLITAPS